jgi:hypothetical protein
LKIQQSCNVAGQRPIPAHSTRTILRETACGRAASGNCRAALRERDLGRRFNNCALDGVEAAIPVDGRDLPHLRAFVAAFNTAAAGAAQ